MPITFGNTSNPSNITLYMDSLFGQSLAAYSKTLVDNIGASNAVFFEVIKKKLYESEEGGTYVQIPLMYALAAADSYSGYDELSTLPTDGVTDAIFQWRQVASPIAYNMREVLLNRNKIVDLVKTRIKQTEMGMQEYFNVAFLHGAAADGGSLTSERTSIVNGSLSITPLPRLISFDVTSSMEVGNINQSTNTWWRNRTKTSAATTYTAFLLEVDNIFNSCSLGTGGKPDLIVHDQVTHELFARALYSNFRFVNKVDEAYPFENIMYRGARFVMEDKVPDVFSGTTSAATWGTQFYINSETIRIKYLVGRDFELLKDENGKAFQKPINGDSRVGHVAWMGNTCINNRRKNGVLARIARTMS